MEDSNKRIPEAFMLIPWGTPVFITFDHEDWVGIYEGLDLFGNVLMRELIAVHGPEGIVIPELTRILIDRVQYISDAAEKAPQKTESPKEEPS